MSKLCENYKAADIRSGKPSKHKKQKCHWAKVRSNHNVPS